jgi:hypothetical protein
VAKYLRFPESLELLVPAPMSPREKIALIETYLSESYASLFKRSIVDTSGLEILKRPIASGTVLLIIGSPYYKR